MIRTKEYGLKVWITMSHLPHRDPSDYADRESFIDQIAHDCMKAADAGVTPTIDELLKLYPDHESELREFLETYGDLGGLAQLPCFPE